MNNFWEKKLFSKKNASSSHSWTFFNEFRLFKRISSHYQTVFVIIAAAAHNGFFVNSSGSRSPGASHWHSPFAFQAAQKGNYSDYH